MNTTKQIVEQENTTQAEYDESDQRAYDDTDTMLYEILDCEYVGNGKFFFDKDDGTQ